VATSGVIHLYKPAGRLSARYCYKLRPILGERRVGHAGTLDPFADGVLVVCVGKATRLVERLMGLPKTYRTELTLGVTNRTFDPEQPFEPVAGARDPGRAVIERAVAAMVGVVAQSPPAFSAVKVEGQPAYVRARRAARRGAAAAHADLPARAVRIDAIEIERYAWPALELMIRCGRGTYIRAIARDLGAALGCGACCRTLTRTAVGPFEIEDAVDLTTASAEQVRAALRPVEAAVALLAAWRPQLPPPART
jgi:tRNA pseudouridine55 synthase